VRSGRLWNGLPQYRLLVKEPERRAGPKGLISRSKGYPEGVFFSSPFDKERDRIGPWEQNKAAQDC